MERTWWDRNWKWFLPVIVVGSLAAFVGFAGLIMVGVFGAMKSSDVYQGALAAVQADARVARALGSPVKVGFFLSGQINIRNSSGDANLAIPLSGPKGKGTFFVVATKSAGTWIYSNLVVQVEGKVERVDLNDAVLETPIP